VEKAWKNPGLRFSPKPGEDCLVAHKDRGMMTLGYQSAVSILDAATGRTLGVCEGTDGALELRCENDTLVVNRAGESLMAFDTRDARPLWKVDTRIFNMVINSERVMYFDQTVKALVCLRLEDGTSAWQNAAVRPKSIMTHGEYVVLGPDLQVLSVETGKVLWTKTMKEKISESVHKGLECSHSNTQNTAGGSVTGISLAARARLHRCGGPSKRGRHTRQRRGLAYVSL